MKTRKVKNITLMNVWDFKESYKSVWKKHGTAILMGINKDGFFMVEAGKEDSLKLTY